MTALNGLTLCLLISAVSLFVSEATGPVHAGILCLCVLYQRWRWSGRGGPPDARRLLWEWASLAALFVFIADLFVASRNLIGAALRLLVFIVAYHADNPQTPRRARQTLGLGLIQMIAASASTTEIGFSFLMAAFLVAVLWTLAALGAVEAEAPGRPLAARAPDPRIRLPLVRLIGRSSAPITALALGIFFVIPHYGTGYFRQAGPMQRQNISGFSETIQLGSIGSIKRNHATVMRIRRLGMGGAPPLPLRMRGLAFDRYDGRGWSISDRARTSLRQDGESGAYLIDPGGAALAGGPYIGPSGSPVERSLDPNWLGLEILLEPLETRVLFTPPDLATVSVARWSTVYMDQQGSLLAMGPAMRRFPYVTVSRLTQGEPSGLGGDRPPGDGADHLQLPPLDPRIADLARSIEPGLSDPLARARAVEAHLLGSYAYSLDVDDLAAEAPLTRFLIERMPGHCEYFATAMAVLLRIEGMPSRIVNGFNGGEHSEFTDQTIIRQSDAHSWVEAWIPGRGWVTFDPTPPDPGVDALGLAARLWRLVEEAEMAWDTYIVGLDLGDQQNAFEEIRDRVDLAAAGVAIRLRAAAEKIARIIEGPERALRVAGLALAIAAVLAAAAGALTASVRLWRHRVLGGAGAHPATILFRRFEKVAARRGLRRGTSMTPAAFARSAGAPEVATAFEAARYGSVAPSAVALGRLRSAIESHRPAGR